MKVKNIVEITFGHTGRASRQAVDQAAVTQAEKGLLALLANTFGGASLVRGEGAYIMEEDGSLVIEPNTTIKAVVLGETLISTRTIKEWCSAVAYQLDQESVMLTIGDTVDFVTDELYLASRQLRTSHEFNYGEEEIIYRS